MGLGRIGRSAGSVLLSSTKRSLILPNLGTMFPNMGTKAEAINLSSALFSKVQQRVLGLIFAHPDHTSEIIRTVESGTGAVVRELGRLQRSGLVSVESVGNQKHYRANRHSPIFEELQGLVLKTVALREPLKRTLEPYADKIKTAFVYGSVAKGTDTAQSDIDVMVIGDDLNYSELYTAFQHAEDRLLRKINPTFLSANEWRRRCSRDGSFIQKLSARPMMFILGSKDDLRS
jgi:predicted nucleotidyltransferase